ncbi:helix-turn-helix domain-containing protein [Couchioplanes caeruleus]|uniref:AceR5 n=3 Tax=Couchioplanes caeruleus TaxID=56438 RepID=A0A1K0FTT6_9ACTN|nr:helix-turn-helix transcriptional regulator [Couchioplanes caeruleus]OJF16279.1 AceR5 [Couchioplanes caeruleus subsp. caeruleus]ROP28367.1 regulatory LuxR family protein [Couchioplanes caeruleus]
MLREAAAEAIAQGRESDARELLELALRDQPDGPAAAELADLAWWLDPPAGARTLTQPARQTGLTGPAASVLARRLAWHGLADEAAAVLDAHPDTGIERIVTGVWLSRLYPGSFTPSAGEPAADRIAATHPWLRGTATPDAVLQGLRLHRAALEPLVMSLLALENAQALDPDVPWFTDLIAAAGRSGSRLPEALLTAARARAELRRGALAEAAGSAEAALHAVGPAGWGVAVGLPLGTILEAFTAQGRHEEVADRLWTTVPRSLCRTPYGLIYLRGRGLHYLATGRERAALSEFMAAGDVQAGWGVSYPGLSPWLLDAARAHLALGEPDQARALADRQIAAIGSDHPRVRAGALRVRAATLDPAYRPGPLREAISVFERCGDRWELAHSLAELGQAFDDAGQPSYAHAPRSRARSLAEECGAGPLSHVMAARGEAEEHRAGRSTASLRALSDAERRVAELAAQGYKNREIARRLFLTASTIEQHLTRIYRKLGVCRRSGLVSVPGLVPQAGPGSAVSGRPPTRRP